MSVLKETQEVIDQLAELRLTEDVLRQAVLAGEFERVSCTGFDPVSAAGYEAWRWTVRTLRERLVPLGWRKVDRDNLPLVVEPVLQVAVAVTSGDGATGRTEAGDPTSKYSKGAATASYVRQNRRQLLLFGEDNLSVVPTPSGDELTTWLLLIHSATDGLVYCELSLPAAMDEDGYIFRWHRRILLEPVRLDAAVGGRAPDTPEDDLDVPIRRR